MRCLDDNTSIQIVKTSAIVNLKYSNNCTTNSLIVYKNNEHGWYLTVFTIAVSFLPSDLCMCVAHCAHYFSLLNKEFIYGPYTHFGFSFHLSFFPRYFIGHISNQQKKNEYLSPKYHLSTHFASLPPSHSIWVELFFQSFLYIFFHNVRNMNTKIDSYSR